MEADLVNRLDAVLRRLEEVAVLEGEDDEVNILLGSVREILSQDSEVSPALIAYDGILQGPLAKFVQTSQLIGGDVNALAQLVRTAFLEQREFIKKTTKHQKPSQNLLVALLQPMSAHVAAIQTFRENNRASPFFTHLSAVSDASPSLSWVTIEPAPGPYIGDMLDAGKFYSNKVLKESKERSDGEVFKDWVNAWICTISELQAYVKEFHTTGVQWNMHGMDAIAQRCEDAPVASKIVCGNSDQMNNLHSKNADVISRCPENTNTVVDNKSFSAKSSSVKHKPAPNPKPEAMRSKPILQQLKEGTIPAKSSGMRNVSASKPPRLELVGNKWFVEYQTGNASLEISNSDMKNAVSIYKCDNCVLQVKGKVNTIVMNSCKKTALVFDEVISSVDFINCQSIQSQSLGRVPTISIDKTDGCLIYLSSASLDVGIITAKSSEMNILVPDTDVDGEFKEFAIPEQYRTHWNGMKLETEISDLTLG